MLSLMLHVALFALFCYLVEYPFRRAIRKGKTVRESINIRKSIKTLRVIVQVLCFTTFIGLEAYGAFADGINPDSIKYFGMSIALLYMYFNRFYKSDDILGNISTISKEEYLLKNPKYILYLRGFESDDYGKAEELTKETEYNRFAEYPFMEVVQEHVDVCAVGMTKEIDCPHGATRIYLSDETWKEDVIELMDKARMIAILVNNRESCIWEIEQSRNLLDKTVFLVDDVSKYDDVRNTINDRIEFPQIDRCLTAECEDKNQLDNYLYFITHTNGTWLTKLYRNSKSDYKEMVSASVLGSL